MTTTTTITSTLTSSGASESPQAASIATVAASVGGTVVVLLLALCMAVRMHKRRKLRVGDGTTETELSNVTTKTSDEVHSTFSNGPFVILSFNFAFV
jgi:hypothetical protein